MQVGDYSFIGGGVFVDSGTGLVPARRTDLQMGQLVQVEVGRKGQDVSDARKIIILKGERLLQAEREVALPPKE